MTTRVSSQPASTDARSGHPTVTPETPMEPRRTTGEVGRSDGAPAAGAADAIGPLLEALVGNRVPVRFVFWDGSALGPEDGVGTLTITSVDALRRILWAPGELGVARAFVSGDITVEGDLFALLRALHDASRGDLRRIGWRALPNLVTAAPPAGRPSATAPRSTRGVPSGGPAALAVA